MSLRDHIPVEPLEEERLARIERAIVAELPARLGAREPWWRGFAPWAVAAVAVAAAALFVVVRSRDVAEPPAPVAISAAPDGTRVDLGDAVITTGAGATFTVTRPDGGVDVQLARGRIALEVAPRKGRAPLVVHADDVAVVVVGTKFAVEWDDEVTVVVEEGLVRVVRGAETAMVAGGERWSQPARVAVAAIEAPADEPRADGTPTGDGGDGTVASGDLTPGGGAIDAEVLRERVASAPPGGGSNGSRNGNGGGSRSGSGSGNGARKPAAAVVAEPLDELRKAIRAVAVRAAASTGVQGDGALAVYQKMSRESGATGAQGLYGLARAQALGGRESDALRNLERYIERFPRGAELDAVHWLRLRVLCLRRIDDACRSAAHTYLGHAEAGTAAARVAERVTVTD
jgi:hypothetical protein